MVVKKDARATLLMLLLILATAGMAAPAASQDGILVRDSVETILRERLPVPGASGPVEQSYILIEVEQPLGTLVLFAGGDGTLDLADGQPGTTSTNFLVRSRHLFAAHRHRFNVVVPDAASDILTLTTGLRGLRRSKAHLSDIAAVIEDVQGKVAGGPGLPVCLIGTSRGVISAAAYVATAPALVRGAPAIHCLVLTAPVTEPSSVPNESLDDVPLAQVTVPTLLATHWRDGCFVTPPQGVREVEGALVGAPVVDIRIFLGGATPLSDSCGSLSPHGFLGIEQWVVKVIGNWIGSQPL